MARALDGTGWSTVTGPTVEQVADRQSARTAARPDGRPTGVTGSGDTVAGHGTRDPVGRHRHHVARFVDVPGQVGSVEDPGGKPEPLGPRPGGGRRSPGPYENWKPASVGRAMTLVPLP